MRYQEYDVKYRERYQNTDMSMICICLISISYLGEINPNCFRTTVGEDFYTRCNKFDEILTAFQSFSILKKSGIVFNGFN